MTNSVFYVKRVSFVKTCYAGPEFGREDSICKDMTKNVGMLQSKYNIQEGYFVEYHKCFGQAMNYWIVLVNINLFKQCNW